MPIGWGADLTSRRGMMILCACLAICGVLLLPSVIQTPHFLLPTLFVWGAVSGGLYTMAMTELGDRFTGADLVAGNAVFAIAFGIGGIFGGPVTGVAMDVAGAPGFIRALAAVFIFVAIFAYVRRRASHASS